MRPVIHFFRMLACSAAVFTAMAASSQTVLANTVNSSLSAQVVSVVDGKSVMKPATDAKPGDVLEYRATYANNTRSAINGLLATIPVPVGSTFIEASAVPAGPTASVDTVTFSPLPLVRTTQGANGVMRKEPVALEDYRAVRWNVGTLAAGQETVVSLRVLVNPVLGAQPNPTLQPAAKP